LSWSTNHEALYAGLTSLIFLRFSWAQISFSAPYVVCNTQCTYLCMACCASLQLYLTFAFTNFVRISTDEGLTGQI